MDRTRSGQDRYFLVSERIRLEPDRVLGETCLKFLGWQKTQLEQTDCSSRANQILDLQKLDIRTVKEERKSDYTHDFQLLGSFV